MKMTVKLKDLGVKPKESEVIAKSDVERKPTYPTIDLNSDNIDGIGSLTSDSKCVLMFEAEVKNVGKGVSTWGSDDSGYHATFILKKGKIQPKETAKDYTDAKKRAKEDMGY